MTSRDFCLWLQGSFELSETTQFNAAQTDIIKRHLALVFLHEIDPSAGPPEHQAKLDAVHDPLGHTRPNAFAPPGSPLIRC